MSIWSPFTVAPAVNQVSKSLQLVHPPEVFMENHEKSFKLYIIHLDFFLPTFREINQCALVRSLLLKNLMWWRSLTPQMPRHSILLVVKLCCASTWDCGGFCISDTTNIGVVSVYWGWTSQLCPVRLTEIIFKYIYDKKLQKKIR